MFALNNIWGFGRGRPWNFQLKATNQTPNKKQSNLPPKKTTEAWVSLWHRCATSLTLCHYICPVSHQSLICLSLVNKYYSLTIQPGNSSVKGRDIILLTIKVPQISRMETTGDNFCFPEGGMKRSFVHFFFPMTKWAKNKHLPIDFALQ